MLRNVYKCVTRLSKLHKTFSLNVILLKNACNAIFFHKSFSASEAKQVFLSSWPTKYLIINRPHRLPASKLRMREQNPKKKPEFNSKCYQKQKIWYFWIVCYQLELQTLKKSPRLDSTFKVSQHSNSFQLITVSFFNYISFLQRESK